MQETIRGTVWFPLELLIGPATWLASYAKKRPCSSQNHELQMEMKIAIFSDMACFDMVAFVLWQIAQDKPIREPRYPLYSYSLKRLDWCALIDLISWRSSPKKQVGFIKDWPALSILMIICLLGLFPYVLKHNVVILVLIRRLRTFNILMFKFQW